MKNRLFFSLILGFVLMLMAGCSQPAATETQADPPTRISPTLTSPAPAPTATEIPILPCSIVFTSDRDGNREIYRMNPDGSAQTNLTNDTADDSQAVWSPDGAAIAFVSDREVESGRGRFIFIMAADGSGVEQLSQQPDAQFPNWSPAGDLIAFNYDGDIYTVNVQTGEEINLTNSPENDEQPKFSPDGSRILWLRAGDDGLQIFTMNVDGSDVYQVTHEGKVDSAEWSVDGRIFTHWQQPQGICFNCVITADGNEVKDGGGKGTIQEFLPFWTDDGQRVEIGYGDVHGTGHEDIFLVGEIFPDLFFYLTENSGNNTEVATPFYCGPMHGIYPQYAAETKPAKGETEKSNDGAYVIGYTGSIDPLMQEGIDKACSEIDVECIHGENLADLTEKGVDAIVYASNRFDIQGSWPALHEAVGSGFPVFVLNAETNEPGAYNLSADWETNMATLNWMFQEMGGSGDFLYFNYGNSEVIDKVVNEAVKAYPKINVIRKEADFKNPPTQAEISALVDKNPNLGAIWANEQMNDVFWGINEKQRKSYPLIECPTRKDFLESWKQIIDSGSTFRCIAHIRPGGLGYDGIYAVSFYLQGLAINPDALVGEAGNTFKYETPVITNETLNDWLGGKLDKLQDGEKLTLPPLDPKEIWANWFIE